MMLMVKCGISGFQAGFPKNPAVPFTLFKMQNSILKKLKFIGVMLS